jgi:hypothetical protein
MKSLIFTIVCLSVISGICAQNLTPSLQPFKYLIGSWSFKTQEGELLEFWKFRDAETLIGRGYQVNNGDSSLLETVLLTSMEDGVYYIPSVEGQNIGVDVRFKLVSSANHTYVFENKDHDFPQRVVYRIRAKDELIAWIEGVRNGKVIKKEFAYKRIYPISSKKN